MYRNNLVFARMPLLSFFLNDTGITRNTVLQFSTIHKCIYFKTVLLSSMPLQLKIAWCWSQHGHRLDIAIAVQGSHSSLTVTVINSSILHYRVPTTIRGFQLSRNHPHIENDSGSCNPTKTSRPCHVPPEIWKYLLSLQYSIQEIMTVQKYWVRYKHSCIKTQLSVKTCFDTNGQELKLSARFYVVCNFINDDTAYFGINISVASSRWVLGLLGSLPYSGPVLRTY